jgi:hypothetical protein
VHVKAHEDFFEVKPIDVELPDGAPPVDYGTAGVPIAGHFLMSNRNAASAGLADGMTLAAPFAWTSGSYPGGSGTVTLFGAPYDFCTNVLAPHAQCVVAVSYSGATSGSSYVTIGLTGAYEPTVSAALQGTATGRALVTVSEHADLFGATDNCGDIWPSYCPPPVGIAGLNLVVTNRGALAVTSLGEGVPLGPPFHWGIGAGASFPGGSGHGAVDGVSFNYCSHGGLAPGEQCLVTVGVDPYDGGGYTTAVDLAYADPSGPVAPDAIRHVVAP